jgi:lipid II:glycine glycyltransferase (peptidoglycan interpeptide bridge formation enzyme)
MSKNVHRDKMPNYLLQWEAILYTREKGCLVYDLWGAPEKFESGDPLYNVFRFKQGLGGDVLRTLGAWDYPSHAGKYYFYRKILPVFLNILRRKGMARLQSVND